MSYRAQAEAQAAREKESKDSVASGSRQAPRMLLISGLGGLKARDFQGVPSETTLDTWAGVPSGPAGPCAPDQGTGVAGQSCSSLF